MDYLELEELEDIEVEEERTEELNERLKAVVRRTTLSLLRHRVACKKLYGGTTERDRGDARNWAHKRRPYEEYEVRGAQPELNFLTRRDARKEFERIFGKGEKI